jgi:hypothetical protein
VLKRKVCGVLLLAVFACSRTPVDTRPTDRPLSYASDVEPLIVKRCLVCHETKDAKAKLVLEVGTGYAQLVGRASTQIPELNIVEPGSAEDSYLWIKLIDEQSVGKGMPKTLFGSKRLPQPELDLIKAWISSGAVP